MRTVNVDEATAEQALVVLAGHVPPQVEIGRPLVAAAQDDDAVLLVTTSAHWWSRPEDAERLVHLPDGRTELTCWADGVELFRWIE
ncbi:hypothetical protein [Micromonospora zamorensis]|uniref:hypothetical protein n=1 Tax=Micromonospora zamorensis TaxID=709883 RepID=UPI0033E89DE0